MALGPVAWPLHHLCLALRLCLLMLRTCCNASIFRVTCPEPIVGFLWMTVVQHSPPGKTPRRPCQTIGVFSRHVDDWANRTGCTLHQTDSAPDDPTRRNPHQRLVVQRMYPGQMGFLKTSCGLCWVRWDRVRWAWVAGFSHSDHLRPYRAPINSVMSMPRLNSNSVSSIAPRSNRTSLRIWTDPRPQNRDQPSRLDQLANFSLSG